MAAYHGAWTQPGVWQAMLAWYRAAPFDVPAIDAPLPVAEAKVGDARLIDCPVLVIWGDKDAVFVPDMADAIALACRDCRVERIAHAGHAPHRDDPDLCAALVRDFLLKHPVRAAQKE
jgi:pimeloyl-ACP methyl ester carboxylesterase